MRLATKNEVLTLLGNCAPTFAAFCTSPEGTTFNFLFQNTTNFDLDDPLVAGMLSQLAGAGIIDSAAQQRFAEFGVSAPVAPQPCRVSYRQRDLDPVPAGADVVPDTTMPGMVIVTVEAPA